MQTIKETGWVQRIAMLNQEITNLLNQQLQFPAINANNYFYLLKLLDNPGITQSDFNALIKVNQSTITRAINSLVEKGYIEKLPAKDKRSQLLQLTPLGTETAQGIKLEVDALNQHLFEKDAAQFDQLLTKTSIALKDYPEIETDH
ncbi:MAG: MarR family winged helix-turn-helix transcriptional regulator [Enterococcus sp.]